MVKIDLRCLGEARQELINRRLLAYRYPVYQVVALPEKPIQPPTAEELAEEKRKKDRRYLTMLKEALRC
jgi:hypothetical protein